MASWSQLAHLRKRGQRPEGWLLVTDDAQQRANLERAGGYALPPVHPYQTYLVSGLEVCFIADYGDFGLESAQLLATANPKHLVVLWRGRSPQVVM